MNHRHDLARLSTINQNSSLTRANTCDYDRMLWVDCAWSRQRTRITRVSLPANPCGRDLAAFADDLRHLVELQVGQNPQGDFREMLQAARRVDYWADGAFAAEARAALANEAEASAFAAQVNQCAEAPQSDERSCVYRIDLYDLPPLLRPIADLVLGEMVKYPRRDIPLGPNNQDRH